MSNTKKPKHPSRANGAMRASIGTKIDTTLVPYEHIVAAAVGLNYGAEKYVERNFEKGLTERDLLGSIDRHTRALMAGEKMDNDSGLPHYILLSSSVAMYTALEMRETVIRDLPPKSISPVNVGNVANQGQLLFDKRKPYKSDK